MKLIQTKEYLLLIDGLSKISEGEYIYDEHGLRKARWNIADPFRHEHNKIIAYFPLTKDSKELDLPLLPNPFKGDNMDRLAKEKAKEGGPFSIHVQNYEYMFKEGYKAAQSKQFSLEDMQKCWNQAFFESQNMEEVEYVPTFFEDFIQSLSTQQLPKEFEPKYRPKHVYGEGVLKIEKNSEGKEVIQGTYKY